MRASELRTEAQRVRRARRTRAGRPQGREHARAHAHHAGAGLERRPHRAAAGPHAPQQPAAAAPARPPSMRPHGVDWREAPRRRGHCRVCTAPEPSVCESSEAGSCAVALARERAERARARRYVILSSDIAGEHRFASAVAQRLSQLGALTQGDRHASSAADALAPFNLQNTCARTPARARAAAAQAPARRARGQAGLPPRPWTRSLPPAAPVRLHFCRRPMTERLMAGARQRPGRICRPGLQCACLVGTGRQCRALHVRARRAPQPSEGYDRVKLGQSRVHPYPYPTRQPADQCCLISTYSRITC